MKMKSFQSRRKT